MTNQFAGRDRFLGGFQRRFTEVALPDKVTVRIQNLSEREKAAVDTAAVDYKKARINRDAARLARLRLIVACVVDESGNRVLRVEDIDQLAADMDSRDVDIIYRACLAWVGGSEEDFEETLGNSVSDPADAAP